MEIVMEIPIFVVISGSDLYGIPEPSDVDIRGVHILDIGLSQE